ncbi:hydroxylysine kinase isoform X1 [Varanus komodoensis]|uniref:Hydroxylysine kinase n=2 Tax=Varanus komodoensis TaxID=61221 RepID=A0A8D2IKQ6_VARKO|nr:hydroxylysine kinase isoform X1 [Varanus komodoensis]XP_044306569.1 hydroxylysine kinase isoform X1 [Varanus komodoensis]XP_044306570.1 hydroxylysine kinase isoform X1 [Varanus komodoensis]XP_044306571.1 hydroxylysine kinase isoform X1 [Varanus komodoensis]XP_044306572.1 hydroxylysine kinase isoform X1 [Varanus komodoensis]
MSSGSKEQLLNLSKPAFSEKQAIELVERIFGLKVSEIKPLPSYDDENFYVRVSKLEEKGEVAEEFVLKIINCEDSRNPELIEVQTRIMMFLRDEGFPVAAPHFTKDGEIMFLESIDADSAPRAYMVRLLSFLPGQTVATLPIDPSVLYEIGQLAARLDKTLAEKFRHPLVKALHRGEFIWNLANVPLLKRYISAVGQSRRLEVVEQVIQRFSVEIVPKLRSFRPCINHGDLNDHNILLVREAGLVSTSPHYRVSGILDFSDMSHGCYVFEVAITTMYMMIESKDPLHVGGHVLAGFESVVPLTTEERAALFLLVCGRFAQSLVMAAHTTLLHPENEEYLMITAKTGWEHLMMLFETGQEAVEKIWFETAKTYM